MEKIKMSNKIWENHGDINFLAYGGCMVKNHWTEEELAETEYPELLRHTYDVFYLNTEYGDDGDLNFAALCTIDLTDDFLDWNGMFYYIGQDERIGMTFQDLLDETTISPKLLAKEMVEYMGVDEFSPRTFSCQYPSSPKDYIISDEDLEKWLTDLGAGDLI